MSLYLLLLALQADAVTSPPPLKVRTVVPAQAQPEAASPKAPATPNPTIIYTPAIKAEPQQAAVAEEPATQSAAPIGLSRESLQRILEARKANTERQAIHKQQSAAAQDAVERALAAQPFDMAALKAALIERDRVTSSFREEITRAVLAMLEAVPPAERLGVAKAVIKGELPARAAEAPAQPKSSPVGR